GRSDDDPLAPYVPRLQLNRDALDRVRVVRGLRRPEADLLEDLLDLAHGERARAHDLLTEALRPEAAGGGRAPAELRARALAPEVVPAIVDGDVAAREDVRVDQELRLHLVAREHGTPCRVVPLEVGEGAGHRV